MSAARTSSVGGVGAAKRGQRERLLEGMTEAAARFGYPGASVARVIARAGVSRATFYEHFADRQDCFVAAYRELAARFGASLSRAAADSTRAQRPRAVLRALLESVERDPDGARLLLIEGLAGEARVRAEYEHTMGALGRALEDFLAEPIAGAPQLHASGFALLGGISGVIATRLHRGETARLAGLVDDLLAWIDSYALTSPRARRSDSEWMRLGRRLGPPVAPAWQQQRQLLPRGRGGLAPAVAAAEHRTRIVRATARQTAAKGYTAMTVADIVAEAAVARGTFYTLFRSKQEAFLAAKALALQESIVAATAQFSLAPLWAERVWSGLRAMLGYAAARPELAYLELIETHAAGAAAVQRMFDSQHAFTMFLAEGYSQRSQAECMPQLCSEATGSVVFTLMRRQVLRERSALMLEALPLVVYMCLAPFIGPERALELVDAKVAQAAGAAAAPSTLV